MRSHDIKYINISPFPKSSHVVCYVRLGTTVKKSLKEKVERSEIPLLIH